MTSIVLFGVMSWLFGCVQSHFSMHKNSDALFIVFVAGLAYCLLTVIIIEGMLG